MMCYKGRVDHFFTPADAAHIKREKEKARELRASSWWKNQLAQRRCHYCEGEFKVSELTMDHLTPIIRGGKSVRGNVVPSCKNCNNKKKYFTVSELAVAKFEDEKDEPS